MKYGVNRVTLVGNVGEVPRVSEREGEAFVANFPLATNEFYKNKEGEEISKTEWHHYVANVVTTEIVFNPKLTKLTHHGQNQVNPSQNQSHSLLFHPNPLLGLQTRI